MYPSDHLVMNETQFKQDALKAMEYCKIEDAIFTLGINPTRPDTGYGYIQYIEDEENKGYYKEKIFTEKPPLEIAKTYIKSGEFVWNSGIFIFPGSLMVSKFKKFLPEMADLFLSIFEAYYTPNEPQAVAKVYEKCKNISIDFGIMEKASRVFVILSNFGWSDLGTWASLYEHLPKDYYHNTTNSQVVAYDSSHNIVKVPEDKICILKGLDNFIIVDTDDVLLICPKDQEQSIKDIVSDLKKNVGDQFL